MTPEELFQNYSTPLGAGAYPIDPYRFTNREYLNIYYRTDAAALPVEEVQARAMIWRPTYLLKMVRGYDRQLRICELVRSQISNITIKGAWSGPARLQLFQHAMAPLADLPVLEVLSATHILTDLTLGKPEVVHNYLGV